ncbi:TolC family protein [Deinococcus cavernae]|uniref:TolC family protein n=1 Tax=Deinococcus cavernae TaxID=2320857 RepID=UPI001F491AB7|nr:TolC family protein [Deinococcus cavernae]
MIFSSPFRKTLLLCALLCLGGAQAQDTTAAPPLPPAAVAAPAVTLPDLLTWLRAAPGWQAADYAYRASELQLQAARIRAGLSVSAGGTLAATKIPWDSGEWVNSSSVNVTVSASVLPWSPAREALRSAERSHQAAATELRRTRADLTVQLVRAYAGAGQAAAALSLARAQRDLAAQVFAAAQAQRSAGVIPAEALLERQTALQNAEAGQAQAERGVTLAVNQLRRLLNRDVTLPNTPTASAPLTFRVSDLNEAGLIARALSTRPEVARAAVSVQDAQASLRAAELDARLPDLNASGQFGEIGSSDSASGKRVSGSFNLKTGVASAQATFPLSDTSKLPTGAVLSLSATLPLLGRTQGNVLEQARLGLQQAILALENARESVTLDVRTRLSEYLDEQGAQVALQTGVTRAQTVLDATRARQGAGTATPLDVRQAELGLAQAQSTLQAAQDRLAVAALTLMQASGDLDHWLLAALPALSPTPVSPVPVSPAPGGRP